MNNFLNIFEHVSWANHRIVDALVYAAHEEQEITRLFSHLLYAEKIWMLRILGEDHSAIPLFRNTSLDECRSLIEENEQLITPFLKSLNDRELARIVSYTNKKGITYENSVTEILTHVALHGQYHRGQINMRLRMGGKEPINVDFITFLREG